MMTITNAEQIINRMLFTARIREETETETSYVTQKRNLIENPQNAERENEQTQLKQTTTTKKT
jgi:hypothetical protein